MQDTFDNSEFYENSLLIMTVLQYHHWKIVIRSFHGLPHKISKNTCPLEIAMYNQKSAHGTPQM